MIKSVRLFCFFAVFFHSALSYAQNSQFVPNSFYAFRDAVYMQNTGIVQIVRLYTTAREEIEQTLTGANLYNTLSRCACLLGAAFQADGRKGDAVAYYEKGIAWAEDSISLRPTSEGYQYLAMNITLSCWIRTLSYGLANVGKIEENAEKALALNPRNLAARYIIAAKNIRAPWPIGNMKKGASLLREIINQDMDSMEKEDVVNVYLMMAVVSKRENKPDEEKIWQEKALALYPTNRFRETLLRQAGK